jgi:hypothetical protein
LGGSKSPYTSALAKLLTDAENKLTYTRSTHVINHEDDVAVIKEMDSQVVQFINYYSVGLFISLPIITDCRLSS